jgi:hypothetical protein
MISRAITGATNIKEYFTALSSPCTALSGCLWSCHG